jgi:DNA-binding response OmpR family regulator
MAAKTRHTVLVVEDVEEISGNMAAALAQRGHRVMHAANAEGAIRMAEHNRPTLILTDLDLPTFDDLLRLLRGHADLKHMLVAIIDVDQPNVKDSSVRVLEDFQALDDLMDASSESTAPSA